MVEGLRWCPDLSVPDPYLLLPFFLTTFMIYQGFISAMQIPVQRLPDLAGMSDAEAQARAHRLGFDLRDHETQVFKRKRSILVNSSVALIFGLIMTEVPAGIALYLLASVTTAGVQRLWLQYKYPTGEMITRCKLPMRVRVRNHYRI
jgi:membrane protein insertase Oxa1/YidC/SpoIIIJ